VHIKFVARAALDGWAIVDANGRYLLLQPPYRLSTTTELSETDIIRALHKHGFEPSTLEFDSWESTIEFLTAEFARAVEARRKTTMPAPTDNDAIPLLTAGDIEHYLRVLEGDLIPNGEKRAAEALLAALLQSTEIKENPSLYERCIVALKGLGATVISTPSLASPIDAISASAPSASIQFTPNAILTLTSQIKERCQVWSIGA
jgi:hypothetical protein